MGNSTPVEKYGFWCWQPARRCWSEKSPPLAGRWALINPAECHQRCWAEVHDPPGMPNFYGWRHGVGRIEVQSLKVLCARTVECHMTDISVIKMIISVTVWRIYPSWVNDKLRAWEGLGHSGMFWERLSRDDFRSKLEIISFLSRVMSVSKSFFVSRAFERFGAKCSSSGAFGFDNVLGLFLKTPLRHRAFFCELWPPQVFLENFLSFFPKQSRFYLPDRYGDSKSEQTHFGGGTSKTRMKTRLPGVGEIERRRTINRRRDWYESCAMIHGPEERKKKKRKEVSVWLCEGSTVHHLQIGLIT